MDGFKEYEKKNYQLAFEHWQEGANQNDILSQFYLGLLYKNGLGINQDYTKAFELFEIVSGCFLELGCVPKVISNCFHFDFYISSRLNVI